MSIRKGKQPGQQDATRSAKAEIVTATEEHASRKMTFAENVIGTIKVLAGFGLLGAALWGINLWLSAK